MVTWTLQAHGRCSAARIVKRHTGAREQQQQQQQQQQHNIRWLVRSHLLPGCLCVTMALPTHAAGVWRVQHRGVTLAAAAPAIRQHGHGSASQTDAPLRRCRLCAGRVLSARTLLGHIPTAASGERLTPVRHVTTRAAGSPSSPSSTSTPHIAVLGGGVIGLTTALRALLAGLRVTVVAAGLGGETTSAGAAGLWGPYKLSDTPEASINRWSAATHAHLMALVHSGQAASAGVAVCGCNWLHTAHTPPPSWAHVVDHWGPLSESQLARFNAHAPEPYVAGYFHESLICEGRLYLTWLQQHVEALGGTVLLTPSPLTALTQLLEPGAQEAWRPAPRAPPLDPALVRAVPGAAAGAAPGSTASAPKPPYRFDAVVNCVGLGAARLLGDDKVRPIRGQILRVAAPWVTSAYMAPEQGLYIIPNRDSVVLGGTAQEGDWDVGARDADRARILAGCTAIMPSLAGAAVVGDWVGLRPGRSSVRLESEEMWLGGQRTLVVHSYGHGGAGLTLAWGVAAEALELVGCALSVSHELWDTP